MKRALIGKKFVTGKGLAVTLSCCILYLIIHIKWVKELQWYLIILIDVPMILIIWHRAYQILYDLKLWFFDSSYDITISDNKTIEFPTIAFIIPSCQEPFGVAKMTFDSVVAAPYRGKKEFVVVDNSTNQLSDDYVSWKSYVENFSIDHADEDISAIFLHNDQKGTLKPGNLDLGQKFIKAGKFVVFLDVDSTLPANENLLERTIVEFKTDKTLGFIQFRIKATNSHFNPLTQAVAVSQDLLRLRMISRGYGGYKIFEGHNGIWRKTVLEEIGPWTEYYRGNIIITEDILKSAHAYSAGYYGKPLDIVTGEWVPSSLKALESMWMRWMYGNSQVFFKSFRKIYSRKTTLIEKFDISYHLTHHLVTLFFLFIAFLLQWTVHGSLANIFIITIGIMPQVISAATSYFTSVRKMKMPVLKKLQCMYASFFMIESFIMLIQIRSDINFILGIPQGWKVTEKGVENRVGWKGIILNNIFYFSIAIFSLVFCVISWVINYNMAFNAIHHHFALLFGNINLLLSIVLFGKKGRTSHNSTESAVVNNSNSCEKVYEPVL